MLGVNGSAQYSFKNQRVSMMANKKRVLTIGGATQDIYLRYSGSDCMKMTEGDEEHNYMLFESGSKIEVEEILYYTGGGATNSAVSFKRLGFDVSCFCMIGDDLSGKAILEALKKEDVDSSKIITSTEHASGTSYIVNSPKGERVIFAYRGANGFLTKKDIPFDLIDSANQIYITSLSHGSAQVLEPLAKYAKEKNIPVATNPGISQLSKGAVDLKNSLKYIDILILNSSEAKIFMSSLVATDRKYENFYFNFQNFFKEVMKMGPKIVVVTDGARGVYVAKDNEILFYPSLKIEVVDTLGAGDSFGSCFVGGIVRGMSVEDALCCGIVNSASVITKIGAKPGLLTYEELEKRVKKLSKEALTRHKL
jgi:sugar/nucleoside kinase (ribokinase family)